MDSERTRLRRLQVIEAAVHVIGEKGMSDTRVADVAKQAGVSPGLLLYYFESKDALLREALTHVEESFYVEVFDELATMHGAPARLLHLIEMSVPDPDQRRGPVSMWKLWPEMWVRALRLEQAADRRRALDHRWRHTIADIVRDGQVSGEFSNDCDAEEFAIHLAALLDGLAIQVILQDPTVTAVRMRRLCSDVAGHHLGFAVPTTNRPEQNVPRDAEVRT